MEEKKLDAAESLELIGRMIENTRSNMVRNAGRPMLIWGYATVLTTLIVSGAVFYTGDGRWNYLWFVLPLAGWLFTWLTRPEQSRGHVLTFVDRVIGNVWFVMGMVAVFVSVLTLFAAISPPITFTLLLLMGTGATLTGIIIRFIPATAGGIVAILLAPLTLLFGGIWQFVFFIIGFVAMMIVPGHMLNYRSNRQQP